MFHRQLLNNNSQRMCPLVHWNIHTAKILASSQDMCSLEPLLRLLRTLPEKMTRDYYSSEISNCDILFYGIRASKQPCTCSQQTTKTLFFEQVTLLEGLRKPTMPLKKAHYERKLVHDDEPLTRQPHRCNAIVDLFSWLDQASGQILRVFRTGLLFKAII